MDADEGSTRVAASIYGRGNSFVSHDLRIYDLQLPVESAPRYDREVVFVAAPGFLGYVVGMFASGNAHVGGTISCGVGGRHYFQRRFIYAGCVRDHPNMAAFVSPINMSQALPR